MKNVTDFRKTVETGVDPHLFNLPRLKVMREQRYYLHKVAKFTDVCNQFVWCGASNFPPSYKLL